jgi:hypothetical protein
MSEPSKSKSVAGAMIVPLASTDIAGQGDVPNRIMIAPWGRVASAKGPFVIDDASAAAIIEAFESHGTDLPIDYEHQTLGGKYASPDGKALAAGWIRSLEARPGEGIFAYVEWTDPAVEVLANRQYRYLSPVAVIDPETRQMVALHSAALTNKPAIVRMQPIVNRDDGVDEFDDLLPVESAGAQRLRQLVQSDVDLDEDALMVCACERISELEDQISRRDAEVLVASAVRAGKCAESQRAWALDLAMREPGEFERWCETAPVVVHVGRFDPPNGGSGEGRGRRSVAGRARAEYRAHRALQLLTDEDAYVQSALRDAGQVPA